jgi:hypothetical protein
LTIRDFTVELTGTHNLINILFMRERKVLFQMLLGVILCVVNRLLIPCLVLASLLSSLSRIFCLKSKIPDRSLQPLERVNWCLLDSILGAWFYSSQRRLRFVRIFIPSLPTFVYLQVRYETMCLSSCCNG